MYILKSHCVIWQLYLNKNIYRAKYLREGSFRELQRTSEGPLEPSPVYRPVLCVRKLPEVKGEKDTLKIQKVQFAHLNTHIKGRNSHIE